MPSSLQYMEKLSQLAYHPLKMQSCYEKMEPLRLDGLQQRFDVSSTSVFKQRAQIHMREVGQRLLPHTRHSPVPSTVPISWESRPLPGSTLHVCRPVATLSPSCSPAPVSGALPSVWNTRPSVHLANSDSSSRSQLRDPFLHEALLTPQAPKPLPAGPGTSVSYFLEAGSARCPALCQHTADAQ